MATRPLPLPPRIPGAPPGNRPRPRAERFFYYFAYGSCMCPVDLKRSLGENTHPYVVGTAALQGYRLGFRYYSPERHCGALDILPDPDGEVWGVLYRLPWRASDRLDSREGVQRGQYRREMVTVDSGGRPYRGVRTYAVTQKTATEIPPNDWYFNVVLRGAIACKLPEAYCWELFDHMRGLQQMAYLPARCGDRPWVALEDNLSDARPVPARRSPPRAVCNLSATAI